MALPYVHAYLDGEFCCVFWLAPFQDAKLDLHIRKTGRGLWAKEWRFSLWDLCFTLEITFQKLLQGTFEIYFQNENGGPENLKWLAYINGRTRSLDFLLCPRKTKNTFQSASFQNKWPMCLSPLLRGHPTLWRMLPLYLSAVYIKSEVYWMRWGYRRSLPDGLVMRGLPPVFAGRGYHPLSLPTCSLTYQQRKQWCWWHLPFKHIIICKEWSCPSPYLPSFPVLRRYLE